LKGHFRRVSSYSRIYLQANCFTIEWRKGLLLNGQL